MKKIIMACLALFLLGGCVQPSEKSPVNERVSKPEKNEGESAKKQAAPGKDEKEDEEQPVQAKPEYRLTDNYSLVPIAGANPNVVLLTIDDAPDKHALEMAKTLKSLEAPAIFFVNGHFLNSPEKERILKEIHDMGFMIGNHTFSHANLKELGPDEQKKEILSVNEQIEKITGMKPKFFRAPFGANTDVSRQIAADEHMVLMNWSYGYDFEKQYMTKEAIADIMVNTELLRPGSNLLMHDREWTNAALKDIVAGLRAKGYEMLDPALIETIEAPAAQ